MGDGASEDAHGEGAVGHATVPGNGDGGWDVSGPLLGLLENPVQGAVLRLVMMVVRVLQVIHRVVVGS